MKLILLAVALLVYTASESPPVFADGWFDDYGSIPWEQERLHLDNFAIYLAKNADMNGYLIFYVGSKEKGAKVEKRISRARKYLVRERKVSQNRIFIINAGKRDEGKTILQPIKKGIPPPNFDQWLTFVCLRVA